jgi:predicted nuclease of predicted toxin-antitoxin system
VKRLADLYPDSAHVSSIGLDEASDAEIWQAAREHDYIIASQDADFCDLSALFGSPPKVIWIRRGNCSTREIEDILRFQYDVLVAFYSDPGVGTLALF